MMIFFIYIIILGFGYYTISYGLYLLKIETNKLGGFGVIFIALLGILVPIITLHLKL